MVPNPAALTVNMLLKPIQHLLDDPSIDEVTINQPGEIWAKQFSDWKRHEIAELTLIHIESLITAVCAYNAVREASNLSLTMPNGERAQITKFPAIIEGQISFNIRKHGSTIFTLEELHGQGAFDHWIDKSIHQLSEAEIKAKQLVNDLSRLDETEAMLLNLKRERQILPFLQQCVLNHKNVVIAGKTGSGKTTFARALIKTVPSDERIITIEDVHELFLPDHPNHVHLMFGSAKGRISADEALASCMRLSPDRIFLAELRGNEAWEYLNSLNTGHAGSITTVHANNAIHTFERVATLIKKSDVGRLIDLETIKLTLYTTIDVILFFHKRQLIEVYYDPIQAKKSLF